MAVLTVTTAADVVNADDGVLSLREAVARANATGAADTIRFAAAVDGRTITLTGGQLTLTQDTRVDGAGSDVTVDADASGRVLAVAGAGTDVVVTGVTITGGFLSNGDGAGVLLGAGASLALRASTVRGNLTDYGSGGGVFAEAGSRLTVRGSTIADNGASNAGGGLGGAGEASLVVIGSRVLDNATNGNGGGIAVEDGSTLTLTGSLVRGNRGGFYSSDGGGGIWASDASVRVAASAVNGNTSVTSGAGISLEGSTLLMDRSTIAGNDAQGGRAGDVSTGGAILADTSSTIELSSSTVTGNTAGSTSDGQPEIFGFGGISGGELHLANSIVAGNFGRNVDGDTRATDLAGRIDSSNGHNIFGSAVDGEAAGDREGVAAARLFAAIDPDTGGGALGRNGGPTPTVALRDALDNPALSGGEPVAGGEVDQRGFERPQPEGSNPDVGAFELDQTAVSRVASAANDLLTGTAGSNVLGGLAGADWLQGRGGNDRLSGNDGGDTLLGGSGADTLDGGTGRDTASFRDAGAAVAASLADRLSSGALGNDRLLRLENLEGGRFADRLEGDALNNAVGGGDGADRLIGLRGEDGLLGGAGDDRLNGGRDADLLAGGQGRDRFDYDALADSSPGAASRDLVFDFAHLADRLDLATLDARSATAANERFTFLAAEGAAFTGAGQVRWFQDGGETFVEANVDAARGADLQIEIAGLTTLTAADFVL